MLLIVHSIPYVVGMIESGLSGSASYHPKKALSQTMKVTSVGSDEEDYLEIHYKDSASNSEVDLADLAQGEGSDKMPSVHTSSSSCDHNQVANSRHSVASQSVSSQNSFSDTRQAAKPDCAVSANERKTSSTSSQPTDFVAKGCDAPMSIDTITHLQRVQSKEGLQKDAAILEDSKRQTEKTDILQFVEDITQVQNVQKPSNSSSLEEAYSPDFSLEGNVDDLLDNDECFSWEDSKGKLQIDTPVEDSSAENSTFAEESVDDTSEKTVESEHKPTLENLQGFDDVLLDAESASENKDKMFRTDSVDSQSSVRSSSSTASNLSAAAYLLKHRISTAFWPEEEEDKVELQVMRPISPSTIPVDDLGLPLGIFSKVSNVDYYTSV